MADSHLHQDCCCHGGKQAQVIPPTIPADNHGECCGQNHGDNGKEFDLWGEMKLIISFSALQKIV